MRRPGRSGWLLLLLVPCIAALWVPAYNRVEPDVAGFPFFYVWLLAWIVLTSILTWIVWRRWHA